MTTSKRQALIERAENALESLHRNAYLNFPNFQNEYEYTLLGNFLSQWAEFKIDHLNRGGAWGGKSTIDFVASRYKTDTAKYIAKRCFIQRRNIEQAKYAMHERISQYGKLYQYGRCGATLAPEHLIKGHRVFSPNRDHLDESNADLTELILIVEAFNSFVKNACSKENLTALWNEYKLENDLQAEIDAHDGKRPRQVTQTIWE